MCSDNAINDGLNCFIGEKVLGALIDGSDYCLKTAVWKGFYYNLD